MKQSAMKLYVDGVSPHAGDATVEDAFWLALENGHWRVARTIAAKYLERDLHANVRKAWKNRPDLVDALEMDAPLPGEDEHFLDDNDAP